MLLTPLFPWKSQAVLSMILAFQGFIIHKKSFNKINKNRIQKMKSKNKKSIKLNTEVFFKPQICPNLSNTKILNFNQKNSDSATTTK
jgi:hypothetical protein